MIRDIIGSVIVTVGARVMTARGRRKLVSMIVERQLP